jgi:hypothetical protein
MARHPLLLLLLLLLLLGTTHAAVWSHGGHRCVSLCRTHTFGAEVNAAVVEAQANQGAHPTACVCVCVCVCVWF